MAMAHANDPDDRDLFVLHLTRGTDAVPRVVSIELSSSEMRNLYAFKTARDLSEVFVDDLAHEIEGAITSVLDGERAVALPDFEVSLPGLLVSGLRILCTKIEGENDVIMMRFRDYVGAIKSAFRFDPSFAVTSASVRERIAVEVLRDILTPLVDMINLNRPEYRAVIENHAIVLQKRLDAIAKRQKELNFYSGLLQRYVAGCRQDSSSQRREIEDDQRRITGT